MASVTLSRVWINLASDMSQSVSARSNGRSDVRSVAGQVRTYSGGRRRVVTRAGTQQTVGATLVLLTAMQVSTLESWRGALVLFRDSFGRKVWGTFLAVPVTDNLDDSTFNVALVLESITHSEAV